MLIACTSCAGGKSAGQTWLMFSVVSLIPHFLQSEPIGWGSTNAFSPNIHLMLDPVLPSKSKPRLNVVRSFVWPMALYEAKPCSFVS